MGILSRAIISKTIILQPDEEIFGYISYTFAKEGSVSTLISEAYHWLGYPFFLSFWLRIFGGSLFSARMFSVLSSTIMIIAVFFIIKKITDSQKFAFFGALILTILPFPLRYGHMILTEPLVWVFLSLSILTLVYSFEKNKSYLFAISGFLALSGAVVRRSALIIFFIIITTLTWTNRNCFKKMAEETLSYIETMQGLIGKLKILKNITLHGISKNHILHCPMFMI